MASTTATSITDLITQHSGNLTHITQEPLAKTGADLIDQLREAEERFDRVSITGGDQLGEAAGLLDQALDIALDGGPQPKAQEYVARAAQLLEVLDEMTAEYRHMT